MEGVATMTTTSWRRPLRLTVYTDAVALGGAEQSLRHLLTYLGDHVTASVLGVDGSVVEWIASARPGTATRVVRPVSGKFAAGAIAEHARAIRELRPDVFHANLRTTFACRYGIALALVAPGVRVVAVEQLPTPDATALQRLHKRLASRRLAAHVAVGGRAARITEEIVGLPPGSVRTIYNGVPVVPLRPRERTLEGPVVGLIGRIAHQKGLDVFVRALRSLEGVTGVIVGDGPQRAELEALAERLGVSERLVITGWQDDARSYLSTFDVYCLPSRFEGFPLAVVEAMLAGLPIVACDVGSVAEAIHDGATGLLVPPDDENALDAALRRVLDDPELATRLGEQARALATEQFTADRMVRAFEDLYDEILR
jgi:glycosyltransferase involved in cell wall biosynthesis